MAAIKQYSLQLHEQIITLCCEEPKELATLFRDRMFCFDTVLHLSVNAVADQREGGEKVRHREAAIFHQELQTNEWMQTCWGCIWKGYVTIFLFFFFWYCMVVGLCACQLKVQWQQQMPVKRRNGFILLHTATLCKCRRGEGGEFNNSFQWMLLAFLPFSYRNFHC